MSATDVLARYGTWALVKITLALLAFVLLHLVRVPVVLLLVVLAGAMSRVDNAVAASVTNGTDPVAGEGIR